MSVNTVPYLVSVVLIVGLIGFWWSSCRSHGRRLAHLDIRIHVNGTRGKSTVTRIIAGMLREAGYKTVAKTTGSAAVVIDSNGMDVPIKRYGAATILEQLRVVRDWVNADCRALVIECMAISPALQEVSERKLVKSNIGVITNVREDHQDVMGETLPEIARSLLNSCPYNGVLVTAKQDQEILGILQQAALERGTRLVVADPSWVTEADLARFEYLAFKENVAIGLAIASILGISWEAAIDGMAKANPDPGVLMLRHVFVGNKRVTWANLFAINDRESAISVIEKLSNFRDSRTTTVIILNNRLDRERRALQFADVAAFDLDADRIATFGFYERLVTERLITNGYPAERIINLGEPRCPSIDEIIDALVHDMPTPHVLLVGLVNIHTAQAQLLMDFIESAPESVDDTELLEAVNGLGYQPSSAFSPGDYSAGPARKDAQ